MATIVWHEKRQAKYILLGAGFGSWKTEMRSTIAGALAPVGDEGHDTYALVSDADGHAMWVDTTQLTVLSVDGAKPSELLN